MFVANKTFIMQDSIGKCPTTDEPPRSAPIGFVFGSSVTKVLCYYAEEHCLGSSFMYKDCNIQV